MSNKQDNYSLKIPGTMDNLEIIRKFVAEIARKSGFSEEETNKIELAVDEACTNVIKHAYKNKGGDIDLALKLDYEKFSIIVTDHGESFDHDNIKLPDMDEYLAKLRVGGLGIYLMKTLMDKVDYSSEDGENEVKMEKYFVKKNNSEVVKDNNES